MRMEERGEVLITNKGMIECGRLGMCCWQLLMKEFLLWFPFVQDKRTSTSPLPFLEDESSVPILETPLLSTLSLTGASEVNRPCGLTELFLLENVPVVVDHEGRSSLSDKVRALKPLH